MKDLYWSEYPEINRDRRKRLELNKTAARSFQRRLKVLSEAIKELNLDIQERQRKSQQVQDKIDAKISRLEFVVKDLESRKLRQVYIIETGRLGLERELFDLRQQKRSEYIRA